MSLQSLKDVFWGLANPWIFMYMSLTYLPGTIVQELRRGNLNVLLSWYRFQSVWFSNFWAWAGPSVRQTAEPRVVPLLEGRVHAGVVFPEAPVTSPGVGGTVLEVGPGSGQWVSLFSDRYLEQQQSERAVQVNGNSGDDDVHTQGGRRKVTRVFGVEPNTSAHPALKQKIVDAGLADVYEIVPLGIEDLERSGVVEKESLDCIVSILCLCSIPDPERNIQELYGYLKPGGRWFVYEHVKTSKKGGIFMDVYQALLNIIWPSFLGGCNIRRDTTKYLMEAGPWTNVDLAQPPEETWFSSLPHILGVLTK